MPAYDGSRADDVKARRVRGRARQPGPYTRERDDPHRRPSAARHDRHPRWRPARPDARPGGPGDGLPRRRPRPGPRLPGGVGRRRAGPRRVRRRRCRATAGRSQRVVTYELEHVAAAVVEAIEPLGPVRPGRIRWSSPTTASPSGGSSRAPGVSVAPWREVRTTDELRAAAAPDALGLPLRLKASTGGYDGRGQIRVADAAEIDGALERSAGRRAAPCSPNASSTSRRSCSVIVARGVDGSRRPSRSPATSTTPGSSRDRSRPRRSTRRSSVAAADIGLRLAAAMGLVGTLTAELFLLRDGSIVVNELAPRVHNSGHWTIEGAATSQFEQHIRAICGLGLGSTAAARRRPRWSTCSAPARSDGRGSPAWPPRSPIPTSTSISTTSGRSSNDARWGTSRRSATRSTTALTRARAARDALGWAADPTTKEDR